MEPEPSDVPATALPEAEAPEAADAPLVCPAERCWGCIYDFSKNRVPGRNDSMDRLVELLVKHETSMSAPELARLIAGAYEHTVYVPGIILGHDVMTFNQDQVLEHIVRHDMSQSPAAARAKARAEAALLADARLRASAAYRSTVYKSHPELEERFEEFAEELEDSLMSMSEAFRITLEAPVSQILVDLVLTYIQKIGLVSFNYENLAAVRDSPRGLVAGPAIIDMSLPVRVGVDAHTQLTITGYRVSEVDQVGEYNPAVLSFWRARYAIDHAEREAKSKLVHAIAQRYLKRIVDTLADGVKSMALVISNEDLHAAAAIRECLIQYGYGAGGGGAQLSVIIPTEVRQQFVEDYVSAKVCASAHKRRHVDPEDDGVVLSTVS